MSLTYPIVAIVVGVILVVSALSGFVKGFVRKISGIAAFILSGILVSALLPTITGALRETAVYDVIRQQCQIVGDNLVKNTISGQLGGLSLPGDGKAGTQGASGASGAAGLPSAIAAGDGSGSIDRSKVKALLQQYGYDASFIDNLSDSELKSYVQQYVGAYAGMVGGADIGLWQAFGMTGAGSREIAGTRPLLLLEPAYLHAPFRGGFVVLLSEGIADAGAGTGQKESVLSQFTQNLSRVDQIRFIEDLPIPQVLKEQMEAFNNSAGYVRLGVSDFGNYIISYFANLILNIAAFLVTLLISWLIIRSLLGTLSVFTRLPIVGTANRLLGLALGVVQGVLFVWALFLLLSLFSTTPVGTALMAEINATPLLELLYNSNPFMNTAVGTIRGIM